MKILVVDDNPNNITTALQTLKGHEVTTCSNAQDADAYSGYPRFLFMPQTRPTGNYRKDVDEVVIQCLAKEGVVVETGSLADKQNAERYKEVQERVKREAEWYWDAVLLDFLMPFNGREDPVGMMFALQAVEGGAKYVLVSSNSNVHDNPDDPEANRSRLLYNAHPYIKMNETFFMATRFPPMVKIEGTDQEGKDWGKMLDKLIAASK